MGGWWQSSPWRGDNPRVAHSSLASLWLLDTLFCAPPHYCIMHSAPVIPIVLFSASLVLSFPVSPGFDDGFVSSYCVFSCFFEYLGISVESQTPFI